MLVSSISFVTLEVLLSYQIIPIAHQVRDDTTNQVILFRSIILI